MLTYVKVVKRCSFNVHLHREELDKTRTTVFTNSRTTNSNPHTNPQSPVARVGQTALPQTSNGSSKLPPTGPRAHKKPRLSETPNLPASAHLKGNRSHSGSMSMRRQESSDSSPRSSDHKVKTSNDDGEHRGWSPERNREHIRERERDRPAERDRGHERDRERPPKERERDRHPHRERDRDRERDRTRDFDRTSKRNGAYGSAAGGGTPGGGGRRARRGSNANSFTSGGDRTLKERMGL